MLNSWQSSTVSGETSFCKEKVGSTRDSQPCWQAGSSALCSHSCWRTCCELYGFWLGDVCVVYLTGPKWLASAASLPVKGEEYGCILCSWQPGFNVLIPNVFQKCIMVVINTIWITELKQCLKAIAPQIIQKSYSQTLIQTNPATCQTNYCYYFCKWVHYIRLLYKPLIGHYSKNRLNAQLHSYLPLNTWNSRWKWGAVKKC